MTKWSAQSPVRCSAKFYAAALPKSRPFAKRLGLNSTRRLPRTAQRTVRTTLLPQFFQDVVKAGEGEVGMQGLLALAVRIQPLPQHLACAASTLLLRGPDGGAAPCRHLLNLWRNSDTQE